jgi:hypothetical protein
MKLVLRQLRPKKWAPIGSRQRLVRRINLIKRFGSFSLATLAIFCMLFMSERKALGFSGYVDPGSGLLALQAITSVVVATTYYLRRRIAAFFAPKKDKQPLTGRVSARPDNPRNPA